MNLTEYLKTTCEKPYKFALRAGVSVTPIYTILRYEAGEGHGHIFLANALKIKAASEGRIALEDLGKPRKPPEHP